MSTRVVIAEDEAIIRLDLKEMLEEEGYEVVAESGRGDEAIDLVREHQPDLAILDVNLDDGNVFALARKLAEEDVPVIFHSGQHTPEEVKARFPDATTLTKPCPPTEVIEAVNKVLETA